MSSNRKIYVGNLPPDTTVRDIEKLFGCYGKIIDIDIKNRNGPPFAFIQYDDRRDAEDAVRERDDYDLGGFSLRVEFPRNIKQNKPDYHSVESYERPHFYPNYGQHDMYMPCNFNGYPMNDRFQYYGDYRQNNNYSYQNRRPRPVQSTDFRVYLSNLPPYSNWQDIKDFMRRYGEVSYADVLDNGNGVCDFVCKEDFKYVISHVNNIKFRSASGQTSYIKVEEDLYRRRTFQKRSYKNDKYRESKSRSRSKTVASKSSNDKRSSSSSGNSSRLQIPKSKFEDTD